MFAKSLKDMSYPIMMKSEGTTSVNAEVIHVNFKPLFSHKVREDVIHKSLECGGCIAETEEHDCRFIESEGVMKVAFHWSDSLIQMLLYPYQILNLVK